ncbi:hypothetical protein W59_21368 [Rhodococcus opacus RKJ300 = JCM 13270]|uniref:Uncharacterized protein n=1 Tax=Rhodococcus opacus RKJ300 = JCM 13270 TaxID=1165867 RepID=I0WNH7_RHOOP|nr:hypothetical protein W59_21368 [Rhodococcus opacus RKJ300 = JCM 13270]
MVLPGDGRGEFGQLRLGELGEQWASQGLADVGGCAGDGLGELQHQLLGVVEFAALTKCRESA